MDVAQVALLVVLLIAMLLTISSFGLVIWAIVRLRKLESKPDNFSQIEEEPQQPINEQPGNIDPELTPQVTMKDSKIVATPKPKVVGIGADPKTTTTTMVQKSQKEKVIKQKSPASNKKPKIEEKGNEKTYMFPIISQVQKDSTSDQDVSLKNFVEKQQGMFKQYEVGKVHSRENVRKENTLKLTPEQSITNKTIKLATHDTTTKPMSQMNAEKDNEPSSGTPENNNNSNHISINKGKKKRKKGPSIKTREKKENKNNSPNRNSKSKSNSREEGGDISKSLD